MIRSFLAALQFLTVIPIPARLDERDFERSPVWFPLVGLLLGGIVAVVDAVLAKMGLSGLLLSALSVGLLAALSGGLHLDGLADTADGFLSARPRERVLEIMRDSHIGTMGVLALIFVLAIKGAALTELTGPMRWKALLFAPLAGRCLQIGVMGLLPYARKEGGLAGVFLRRNNRGLVASSATVLCVVALLLLGFREGLVLVFATAAVAVLLSLWSLRRIGGFTGDTLGATSEIVEAVVFVAVIMPRATG